MTQFYFFLSYLLVIKSEELMASFPLYGAVGWVPFLSWLSRKCYLLMCVNDVMLHWFLIDETGFQFIESYGRLFVIWNVRKEIFFEWNGSYDKYIYCYIYNMNDYCLCSQVKSCSTSTIVFHIHSNTIRNFPHKQAPQLIGNTVTNRITLSFKKSCCQNLSSRMNPQKTSKKCECLEFHIRNKWANWKD